MDEDKAKSTNTDKDVPAEPVEPVEAAEEVKPGETIEPTDEAKLAEAVESIEPASVTEPEEKTEDTPVEPSAVIEPEELKHEAEEPTAPDPEEAVPIVNDESIPVTEPEAVPESQVPTAGMVVNGAVVGAAAGAKTVGRKRKIGGGLGLVLVIAAGLLILGGGGAAAYYGYVVPNKPENKLLTAFANLLGTNRMIVKGSVDVVPAGKSSVKSVAVDYTLGVDKTTKKYALSGQFGVNGAQLTYDARIIDSNLYAKVGGISGFTKNLTKSGGSATVGLYGLALGGIDSKWVVINRSALNQVSGQSATNACTTFSTTLSPGDIDKLQAAYAKYPPFTIKNTSSTTIDGTKVTKYELGVGNSATRALFMKQLETMSVAGKVKDCLKTSGLASTNVDTSSLDNVKLNTSVYVTGDKQVKRIEVSQADKPANKYSATFTYKVPDITKPANALPLQDVFGL